MSNRFRPNLDALEAREVPAALSFRLPDGSTGSALFSTPDGVNPAQPSQVLAVTDLTVTKGGAAYATQPGAAATYANGALVGVSATAFGPGPAVNLNLGSVQVGGYVAPVAYDDADTQLTFMLSNGTLGAISYEVPWDDVDSSLATQTVVATNFNVNMAGRNTAAPATLTFEYGELKGVNVALTFAPGFAYSSFTINGLAVTAVQAGTNQLFLAAAQPTRTEASFLLIRDRLDKKTDPVPVAARLARFRLQTESGKTYTYEAAPAEGMTIEELATAVADNMKAEGWDVSVLASGRGFVVRGWKGQDGKLDKLVKAGATYDGVVDSAQPKLGLSPGVTGQIYNTNQWQDGSWTKP